MSESRCRALVVDPSHTGPEFSFVRCDRPANTLVLNVPFCEKHASVYRQPGWITLKDLMPYSDEGIRRVDEAIEKVNKMITKDQLIEFTAYLRRHAEELDRGDTELRHCLLTTAAFVDRDAKTTRQKVEEVIAEQLEKDGFPRTSGHASRLSLALLNAKLLKE